MFLLTAIVLYVIYICVDFLHWCEDESQHEAAQVRHKPWPSSQEGQMCPYGPRALPRKTGQSRQAQENNCLKLCCNFVVVVVVVWSCCSNDWICHLVVLLCWLTLQMSCSTDVFSALNFRMHFSLSRFSHRSKKTIIRLFCKVSIRGAGGAGKRAGSTGRSHEFHRNPT